MLAITNPESPSSAQKQLDLVNQIALPNQTKKSKIADQSEKSRVSVQKLIEGRHSKDPSHLRSIGSADFYSKLSDKSPRSERLNESSSSPYRQNKAILHPSVYANDPNLNAPSQYPGEYLTQQKR